MLYSQTSTGNTPLDGVVCNEVKKNLRNFLLKSLSQNGFSFLKLQYFCQLQYFCSQIKFIENISATFFSRKKTCAAQTSHHEVALGSKHAKAFKRVLRGRNEAKLFMR